MSRSIAPSFSLDQPTGDMVRGIGLLIVAGVGVASIGYNSLAHACDDRFPHLCQTAIEAEAPDATEPTKLEPVHHRGRHADLSHGRASKHPVRAIANRKADTTSQSGTEPAPTDKRDPDDAYLSPRPIAAGLNQSIPVPRVEVALFDPATALPLRIELSADAEDNGAAVSASSASIESGRAYGPDQGSRLDPEGMSRLDNPVTQARTAHQDGLVPSWVSLGFIVWAGLLTLGSALRLVIG